MMQSISQRQGTTVPNRIKLFSFILLLSAIYFPGGSWSFQQQQQNPFVPKRMSSNTALSFVSTALIEDVATFRTKNKNSKFFALDYQDVSSRSKRGTSRLSLSSIAVPVPTSSSSLLNDGSDYYSWMSSDWRMVEPTATTRMDSVYEPTVNSILHHSQEYQRRKEEWAKRYTSLNGLREAFGSNRNKLWGDLDAATTRKLYKTLLPNALCELVLELGVEPEELAPLAYKARKAAKLYARERCHVPARIMANLFDGFRQWKRYGRFQPNGMSYEQLWEKYYHQQLEEAHQHHHHGIGEDDSLDLDDTVTEEEIVSQTCQKILEKSCTTNEMIDSMVLGHKHPERESHRVRKHRNDLILERISRTLERDVRKLLDPSLYREDGEDTAQLPKRRARPLTPQEYHALKLFALARKQSTAEKMMNHHHHLHQKAKQHRQKQQQQSLFHARY
jgi:hypothetical protein